MLPCWAALRWAIGCLGCISASVKVGAAAEPPPPPAATLPPPRGNLLCPALQASSWAPRA
jgi:hypothetical protein